MTERWHCFELDVQRVRGEADVIGRRLFKSMDFDPNMVNGAGGAERVLAYWFGGHFDTSDAEVACDGPDQIWIDGRGELGVPCYVLERDWD